MPLPKRYVHVYRYYSNGIEREIMQPVKHLDHLARLCKAGQSVKECLYNPVEGLFHIIEDTFRIQTAHFFLPMSVALYVSLCKDHWLHVWY